MAKISKAERKIMAIKEKYGVGKPNGVLEDYKRLPFFKVRRFILEADGRLLQLDNGKVAFLSMHDVGLYFILNMLAKEDGIHNSSRIIMADSDDIKRMIKNILGKSKTDVHSSRLIRSSFLKLSAAKLINCDISGKDNKQVYRNIKIPHEQESYHTKGFFKFYYVDTMKAIEKIKDSNKKLSVKDFLNLLGVYMVSSLVFFSERETNYLGNGVVTIDYAAPSKYANRIDFTFGLKLSGGVRKKGVKEYMEFLEDLGLVVSMNIDTEMYQRQCKCTLYTFSKNIKQFYKIIEDIYCEK